MLTAQSQRELAILDRQLIENNLRAIYDARKRGDIQALVHLLSEKIRANVVSTTGSYGFVGPVIGTEQMLRALRTIEAEVELLDTEIIDMVIDGDCASVHRKVVMRGRGTGVTREMHAFDYCKFENGILVEVEQFTDTQALDVARGQHAGPAGENRKLRSSKYL